MKKYYLASLVLLYCSLSAIGQLNPDDNLIRDYYQHINRAELNIIDTNYSTALREYQAAFKNKYPNGKDLYNAFVVSFYLKDKLSATNFYNQLAFHGLERGYFKDSNYNLTFYETVTAMHDSSYKAGLAMLDKGAVEFWDIVYEFTSQYRKFGLQMDKKVQEEKRKEMDALNSENILGYLSKGGKFSFEDIGFWTKNSSPHNPNYPFYYHVWSSRHDASSMRNQYKELALDGKVEMTDIPSLYTRLISLGDSLSLGDTSKNGKLNLTIDHGLYSYPNNISAEQINEINTNRAKLYLSNMVDYKRRRTYDSDHKLNSGVWERNMFIFFGGH